MAKTSFNLKMVTTQYQTKKIILNSLAKDVQDMLEGVAQKILPEIQNEVHNRIWNCPEVLSMISDVQGSLRGHLGLENPVDSIGQIIKQWYESIEITVNDIRIFGNRLQGGISIGMIEENYQDVLNLPAAEYISSPSRQIIPWLKWMLISGSGPLVSGYFIRFGAFDRKRSRSEQAIMIKGKASRWFVPKQFSGTPKNNFVTRALEGIDEFITKLIKQRIREALI